MAVGYPVDLGAPAARLCDRLGDCMLGFHLEPYASSCLRSPPPRGTLYGMLGTDAQSTDAAGRLSSERAADPHHSGLRWLQAFTMTTGQRLQPINTAVIARVLATLGVRTWTIGVDGVVVSTGLQVERAFRGFNPHHRKVPSYYPIRAHLVAQNLPIG